MATKKETKGGLVQNLMYVGPTAAKYALVQNTVYAGLPESASALLEAVPLANVLMIQVKDYPKAERSILTETGVYWAGFKAVYEFINGGK